MHLPDFSDFADFGLLIFAPYAKKSGNHYSFCFVFTDR